MLHPRSSKHAPGQSPFAVSRGQSVSSNIHSAASSVFDFPIAKDAAQSRDAVAHLISPALTSEPEDQSLSYLVVSGGTGCNGIVSAFGSNVTYVLPVSDNGGSSSEVCRGILSSIWCFDLAIFGRRLFAYWASSFASCNVVGAHSASTSQAVLQSVRVRADTNHDG